MLILLITLAITIALLALLIALIWCITRFIAKRKYKKTIRYKRFGYTTIAFASIWTIMLVYGYKWGRWRYEVVKWTFKDCRLPKDFDGYRIVHISDMHIEGFDDNPAYLDTMVNAINKLSPDLICFTGDLVSFKHDGLIPHLETLKKLKSRDGIVSILGNHDYAVYERKFEKEEMEADRKELIRLQREELNWKLLLNENLTLYHGNDSIAIIGVENQACGPHQKVRRGNLAEAIKGTEKMFQILLSHDPSHWDAEVKGYTDIPLTLSGHTHAMQFKILGWTPCRWFYKRSDGPYKEGKQQIYVNIGLGELMPFRIGATPEITLITLRK